MKTLAIVLSAGKSSSMKSYVNKSNKVTMKILDSEMILYVSSYLKSSYIDNVIFVVNHQDGKIKTILKNRWNYIEVNDSEGTYLSLLSCEGVIDDYDNIIIVYGCLPLLKKESLECIIDEYLNNNYDVSYFAGLYILKKDVVRNYLNSDVKEIDDLIDLIRNDGNNVNFIANYEEEKLIVKNRLDLALANKVMQNRINEEHMLNGITIVDPNNTYIGKNVLIGNDTIIYPNTYIYGKSIIGVSCELGPNVHIVDSFIDNYEKINNCFINKKTIKK